MLLPRSCCYQPRISSWFQLLNSGCGLSQMLELLELLFIIICISIIINISDCILSMAQNESSNNAFRHSLAYSGDKSKCKPSHIKTPTPRDTIVLRLEMNIMKIEMKTLRHEMNIMKIEMNIMEKKIDKLMIEDD